MKSRHRLEDMWHSDHMSSESKWFWQQQIHTRIEEQRQSVSKMKMKSKDMLLSTKTCNTDHKASQKWNSTEQHTYDGSTKALNVKNENEEQRHTVRRHVILIIWAIKNDITKLNSNTCADCFFWFYKSMKDDISKDTAVRRHGSNDFDSSQKWN